MGVDYSAHLAYGVEIDRSDPAFEDGIYEYETMYAEAMMKAMDIELEDGQSVWTFLKGMPCPVNIMAFGAPNYTGEGTFVITPNELCFSADQYGNAGKVIEVPTPAPEKAAKTIKEFCELLGIPVPEQEPRWYFGMYVS